MRRAAALASTKASGSARSWPASRIDQRLPLLRRSNASVSSIASMLRSIAVRTVPRQPPLRRSDRRRETPGSGDRGRERSERR